MKPIPDAYRKVPMMFQAQIRGRSQLQYLNKHKKKADQAQDVERWVSEWTDKSELIPEEKAQDVETEIFQAKSYQVSWRFVTNGGQDDGIVRPVIDASGIPFYPGSSMKGAFRQACEQAEKLGEIPKGTCDTYCGSETDITPGCLRFEGAYPTNDWTKGLLDLVHPQQNWQVITRQTNNRPKGESPYAQISLDRPTLRFAISSAKPLSSHQWEQIWRIWERALALGLGSKVSGGYGQVNQTSHPILYKAKLKGQGQASKLIDGTGEFRPNIFRASLRGHALRIFGGLTDEITAQNLVQDLFGGIQQREPTVGLLGFQFQPSQLEIESFGSGKYAQPTYDVKGELIWFLNRPIADPKQEKKLKKLVARLMQFAMIFGGFGKSWRRVDHREFFEDYYEDRYKALIGCHWQWLEKSTQWRNVKVGVGRTDKIATFIDSVRDAAREWIQCQDQPLNENQWASNWREAWHPTNVQVWGRVAKDMDDSAAVQWFHKSYQSRIQGIQSEGSIYKSSVTGKFRQISLIWHRMYPVILLKKNPDDPKKLIVKNTCRYLEIITIFPDNSQECTQFLNFLHTHPKNFQRLWGE